MDNLKLTDHCTQATAMTAISNELECFRMCRNNTECKAASFHNNAPKPTCFVCKDTVGSKEEQNWIAYIKKPNNFTHKDPKSYKVIANLRLFNHFTSNTTATEMECFQWCVMTKDCKGSSFSYEVFKSMCFLYKNGFTSKEETKWISYIKIGIFIFFLGNKLFY